MNSTESKIDNVFWWLFKVIVAIKSVIFVLQAAITANGDILFVLLLIVVVAVCSRLRTWSSRFAAAVFTFFLLPSFASYIISKTNPIIVAVTLAALSAGAYRLRERRQGRKPEPFRNQSGERTPILPPERTT